MVLVQHLSEIGNMARLFQRLSGSEGSSLHDTKKMKVGIWLTVILPHAKRPRIQGLVLKPL